MAAAFLAVTAVAMAVMPGALVGVFYDDGIYLALARSLATGHGYHLLYLPGAPAAIHYPFGYPLFLAALWRLWPSFPANVILFRAANAVLLGGFAALTAGHVGPRLFGRQWTATAIVIASATAIPLLTVTTVLFAEPLFLALAAGACWAAEVAGQGSGRRALLLALLAGLLAGLAALTRSIGVAVAVGVVASLLVNRRLKEGALAAALCLVCVLPWSLWVTAHHGETDPAILANYGTYADLLAQSGWRWLTPASLGDLTGPLSVVMLPPPVPLRIAAAVPAFALLLFGVVELARAIPALGFSLAAYLVIVAVWPYGPDRFLWAVLPWLFLAMASGAQRAWQAASRQLKVAVLATVLLVTAGFGRYQALGFARSSATASQRAISHTMATLTGWVREATDSSAVIAGEDEALYWLYTGRRAVPNYLWRARGRQAEQLPPDSLRAFLLRSGASYLVLSGPGETAAGIDALLGSAPGFLRTIRVWPGPMIAFQVNR